MAKNKINTESQLMKLNTVIEFLGVSFNDRFFLEKRYKTEEKTLDDWKIILKSHKIDFRK